MPVKATPNTAAALRSLAINRARIPHPMHIVLDDTLRDELQTFRDQVKTLETARQNHVDNNDQAPASLGDTTDTSLAELDQKLAAAKDALAGVEDDALASGKVLVVNFVRLAPAEYQVIVDATSRAAKDLPADEQYLQIITSLGDKLIEKCFVNATTVDGEDTGLTLDEILNDVITYGELDAMRGHCNTINRIGAAMDFPRASSGRHATN